MGVIQTNSWLITVTFDLFTVIFYTIGFITPKPRKKKTKTLLPWMILQVWDTLHPQTLQTMTPSCLPRKPCKRPKRPSKNQRNQCFCTRHPPQLSPGRRVEGIWNGLVYSMSKPMVFGLLRGVGTGEVGQTWVDSGTNLIEIMFRSCIELTFDRPKPYKFWEN